jgi:hypothetical protein
LFAGLVGATTIYACGSSSNGGSGGTPPPTEAGPDQTSSSSGSSSGGSEASADSPANGDAGPLACGDLPGTVVYVLADATQESLLKVLGRQLRDNANIALAFQLAPSCTLMASLFGGKSIPGGNLFYIPSTAEDPSWKPSDPESTCIGAPVNGPRANLGISALSPTSCPGLGITPSGIGLLTGPVHAYTFIVPTAEYASQKSIAGAEAYYAFGDGANNPVTYNGAPEWNDPTQFFLRPATESSLVASALEVELTPAQMTLSVADGGPADGRHLLPTSAGVIAGVKGATTKAIGLVEASAYDANRTQGVDALAFAAFGQTYAFYPDSTATSFDKQNVRDGHYANWSSTLYVTQVDNNGVPTNAAAKYVTDLVFGVPGATAPEGGAPIDGLADVASVGLVPNCAMQVQRFGEGQALSAFAPQYPCTCYFLSKLQGAQLPASCTTCKSLSDCGVDGALGCLNGYCETPPSQPKTGQPGCMVSDGTNDGILNACTSAAYEQKTNLVVPLSDGGLLPLNP